MRTPIRRGFSLVELLVVMTIIGVLIALLLPAVQAAREAGRQMQCGNQVKQLALALHQYVQARGVLPPGCVVTLGAAPGWTPWQEAKDTSGQAGRHGTSWLLQALPFLEQQALFEQWDFTKNVRGNAEIAQTDIPTLYCPSRRWGIRLEDQRHLPDYAWRGGGNDYGGCIGSGNGWTNNSYRYFTTPEPEHPEEHWLRPTRKGIFLPNTSACFFDIRDGTSHTIMIGELQRLVSPPSGVSSVDSWASGGVATLFTTNDNEASGIYQTGGMNNKFFESPGSEHPGGAHFGMADGSVQFLNEHLDKHVFSYLGSMADGEAVQLP